MIALNWSSGLAAAGQLLFDDFNTKGTTSLNDSQGRSSNARAQIYGTTGSAALTEYAVALTTATWGTQDAVNILLFGDTNTRRNIIDAK